MHRPTRGELDQAVVGRRRSLFELDMRAQEDLLLDRVGESRCLVVGGAGSIGRSTVEQLIALSPSLVHVVDIDENNLVELVRDLRAKESVRGDTVLRTSTFDYGSEIMRRHLRATQYDIVMNFAAVKHVRSERDIPSLLHMLDVNVCKMLDFTETVAATQGDVRLFAVSTDKAAEPVNLMGASKRLMEHVVLGEVGIQASSARFANVAFSAGSLLAGWLRRLDLEQPLPVPADTRRYFVTMPEAGQLCLLAGIIFPGQSLAIPRLRPDHDLRLLTDVASDFLGAFGLRAAWYNNAREAAAQVLHDRAEGAWPVLVTPLDTVGEKAFEEFHGPKDVVVDVGLQELAAVRPPLNDPRVTADGVRTLATLVRDSCGMPTKDEVLAIVKRLVPELRHNAVGANLDDRQ